MMRLKKSFYTISLVCVWCLTCFVIIRNGNFTNSDGSANKFNDKLKYLENGIKEEIVKRDKLLQTVSKILKTKESIPPPPIPVVLQEIETENSIEPNERNHSTNQIKFNGIYVNDNIENPVIPVLVLACNRVSFSIN